MGGRGSSSGFVKAGSIPDAVNHDGEIARLIKEGKLSTKHSYEKYKDHLRGTKNFDRYKSTRAANGRGPQSELTISFKEAQELIDKYAGTATGDNVRISENNYAEFFDADHVIGKYPDGKSGEYIETVRFMIVYASDKAHVVPVGPKPKKFR